MWVAALTGLAVAITVAVAVVFIVLRINHLWRMSQHFALTKLKLSKLPVTSTTRRRIEASQRLFDKGWQMLKTDEPYSSLAYFARAVELDEMGCRWRKHFSKRLEKLGDLFSAPPESDSDKYHSMLAEAYLVMLLHTVVSEHGSQGSDLEEDFRVVKTRLDACANLQPENPMIYKLRADFLSRFGHRVSKEELVADYKRAIELAEEDDSGKHLLGMEVGVDPKEQRRFLLAHCYHALGGLQQRQKQSDAAYESYSRCVTYADPEFVNLADACFSLCVLAFLKLRREPDPSKKPAAIAQALLHYKAGLKAQKAALTYLPFVSTEVSRSLAKEMIRKFASTKAA